MLARAAPACALLALAFAGLLLTGCNGQGTADATAQADTTSTSTACPPGATDSLALPDGFCATVFHEGVGPARHLAVRPNGDVYVKLSSADQGGGIAVLRDTNGDGNADRTERFGASGGTGIEVRNGALYASSNAAVMRWPLPQGRLVPPGQPETVVDGFPQQRQHAAKSLALDGRGALYVNVGAPSNACQQESRTAGSPGQDPCPLLEEHGGIWRFDASQTGQTHSAGARYATGIRNAVALGTDTSGQLYVAQHGRDQLHSLWPDLYTEAENAKLPAEELFAVSAGDNFGWPYCYYDQTQDQKVLAPEYGGDGQAVGRCSQFENPITAFPGHWAPNDLLFYTGQAFPSRYRGGVFIAFHGSWNRAPLPQQGYRVAFVPFENGEPSTSYTTFANGFAGTERIQSPGQARYRPMGLAQGPDGALYISDSQKGRIWRVTHPG